MTYVFIIFARLGFSIWRRNKTLILVLVLYHNKIRRVIKYILKLKKMCFLLGHGKTKFLKIFLHVLDTIFFSFKLILMFIFFKVEAFEN